MKKKCFVVLLALIAMYWTIWKFFPNEAKDTLISLYESLVPFSSLLFSAIGVWICVLNPATLLDRNGTEKYNDREALGERYINYLVYAAFPLILTVVSIFVLKLTPCTIVQRKCINSIFVTAAITFLFIDLWIVLTILIPVLLIKIKRRQMDDTKKLLQKAPPPDKI